MLKLPDLVKFEDYSRDWNLYEEALYEFFKKDFLANNLFFKGKRVVIIRDPKFKEKEATFWHITSQGKKEDERIPDFRKCERIKWIRPIIENYDQKGIRYWENNRRNGGHKDKRICLCYENWEYLVVLAKRTGYFLLWTAYPVEKDHTKDKLKKEYDAYKAYKKANTAS